MRFSNLILVVAPLVVLSGCTAFVTQNNAQSFDSWELCTLLYNPTAIYSDWITLEKEEATIRSELYSRGITNRQQCNFEALAESKCRRIGFVAGTTEMAQCRLTAEQNFKELLLAKKVAHDEKNKSDIQQNLFFLQQQQVVIPAPPPL